MNTAHDLHIVGDPIDRPSAVVLSCSDCSVELRVSATTQDVLNEVVTLALLWHEGRVRFLNAEEVAA